MPAWTTPHFSSDEFKCRCGCGQVNMDPAFIDWLERVRTVADIPFFITSGFRCQAHNAAVGGVPNSAHCRGTAADIRVNGGGQRHIIVKAALGLGGYGIGIAQGFVHLDMDRMLPRPAIWSY